MKLVFQTYLADQQQFLFSVDGTKPEVYRLMTQLNNRILFHCQPMFLEIKNIDQNQFIISRCQDKDAVSVMLSHIEMLCKRQGVENWQAFANEVKNQLGIVSNSQAIVMNSLSARDIRFHIVSLLNMNDKLSVMTTGKTMHFGPSPEESLRQLFPHIHQTMSTDEMKSEDDKDKAYLLARKTANEKEYQDMYRTEKFLMHLCKTGDVVRFSDQFTAENYSRLMRSCDINSIYALDWAYKNGHHYLLNKIYRGAIKVLYSNNENSNFIFRDYDLTYTVLDWAIACRQPLETLEKILRNNLIFYQQQCTTNNSPIYSVISYQHYEALELCQRVGLNLSHKSDVLLYNMLLFKKNRLEMARYLAEKIPDLKHDNLLPFLIKRGLSLPGIKFACEQLGLDVNKGETHPLITAIDIDVHHYIYAPLTPHTGLSQEYKGIDRVKYLCQRPGIVLYHSHDSEESALYYLLKMHYKQTNNLQKKLNPTDKLTRIFHFLCAQPSVVFGYFQGLSLFASHEAELPSNNYFMPVKSQTYLETALQESGLAWLHMWKGRENDLLFPLHQCLVNLNQSKKQNFFSAFTKLDFSLVLLANMIAVHVHDESPSLLKIIEQALKIIADTQRSSRDFQLFGKVLQDMHAKLAAPKVEEESKSPSLSSSP